jgi:hypothetical protein
MTKSRQSIVLIFVIIFTLVVTACGKTTTPSPAAEHG